MPPKMLVTRARPTQVGTLFSFTPCEAFTDMIKGEKGALEPVCIAESIHSDVSMDTTCPKDGPASPESATSNAVEWRGYQKWHLLSESLYILASLFFIGMSFYDLLFMQDTEG